MAASRNCPPPDLRAIVGAFLAPRLAAGERLAVGLSGGCDSVVLAHLLAGMGFGERLSAIHVHHGLSPNADAWAAFCVDFCAGLKLPLCLRRVTVARGQAGGLEAAARAARYQAFAEAGVDAVLLAHHRGDQAETVLFNLLRGSGVAGAAGMPAERRAGAWRILRPLLGIGRDEIEAYARQAGLSWINDESNADIALTRNFLRHQALPLLAGRFPGVETALARSAGHFAEAVGLLDDLADLDWQAVADGEAANMRGLRRLPAARLKNLLRCRLRRLGWQLPVASRLDEFARQLLSAAPDRHPELVLPDGILQVREGRLHWRKAA